MTTAQKEIVKSYGCTNYYVVNNKKIEHIHFFKDGEILYTTRAGWLEASSKREYGSGQLGQIEVSEVKKAIKLNLNKKENFTFKNDLYLFIDDNSIKVYDTKRVLNYQNATSKNYMDIIKIELTASYKYGDNTELKNQVFYMPVGFQITELKEHGKVCKAISEDMRALHIDLSAYDIETILKFYDMTKKGNVDIKK